MFTWPSPQNTRNWTPHARKNALAAIRCEHVIGPDGAAERGRPLSTGKGPIVFTALGWVEPGKLGDRTFKLSLGTTSGYGRYGKLLLGGPRRNPCAGVVFLGGVKAHCLPGTNKSSEPSRCQIHVKPASGPSFNASTLR